MARISFTTYSNSILASTVSFFGSAFSFCGIALSVPCLFCDDPSVGLIQRIVMFLLILAVTIAIKAAHEKLAERISERKRYKSVIKKIKTNGFEDKIRKSREFALYVYCKFPDKMIKKYVTKLNRESESDIAQIIRSEKEAKKNNRKSINNPVIVPEA